MPRLPALLLACLLPVMVPAQDDPLKSTACDAALQQLQAARAAPGGAGQVESLRHAAARTCLGTGEPPARPGRVAQPPVVVPPPIIEPPPRTALPAGPTPLPPPVAVTRPSMVTTCDAGGCWTSDGDRLNRAGPNLLGPQGVCTVQGALAFCP